MPIDWSGFIRADNGGYMRAEDYCNSGPRGSDMLYTSGILTADDELRAVECGARVANAVAERDIDGWDALLDAAMIEDEQRAHAHGLDID